MAKNIGFNIHLSINGQDVVVNCKKGVQDLGRALGTIPGAAGKAGSAIQAMGAVSSSLRGVYDGINSLKTVCSELTGAYQTQEENEIKLETVMRQRMGATDGMINSIKDLASAQQKQGVVGDEVQLARALINMQRTIILNIVIDLPHPVALSLRPWNIRTTELHYRGHSRTNINTLPSP